MIRLIKKFHKTTPKRYSTVTDEVKFEKFKNVNLVTLNRPQSLNSLNLTMVEK